MIPKGLKVGDTFEDNGIYKVTKVIGENYESIWVGESSPSPLVIKEPKTSVEKSEDFESMPYAQLKKLCAEKGLDATGKKDDLVARLEG